MKYRSIILSVFMTSCFIMVSFSVSLAQISIHDLLGRWDMHQVFRGGSEVTNQYLPEASRWISFDTDNTFVSDGETYRRIEGRYSLDEDTGLLSFNTDLGFGQLSFWQVDFDGLRMTWTDRGNPMHEKIRIILVRDY